MLGAKIDQKSYLYTYFFSSWSSSDNCAYGYFKTEMGFFISTEAQKKYGCLFWMSWIKAWIKCILNLALAFKMASSSPLEVHLNIKFMNKGL